jgi:hypothetical protein
MQLQKEFAIEQAPEAHHHHGTSLTISIFQRKNSTLTKIQSLKLSMRKLSSFYLRLNAPDANHGFT